MSESISDGAKRRVRAGEGARVRRLVLMWVFVLMAVTECWALFKFWSLLLSSGPDDMPSWLAWPLGLTVTVVAPALVIAVGYEMRLLWREF